MCLEKPGLGNEIGNEIVSFGSWMKSSSGISAFHSPHLLGVAYCGFYRVGKER